MDVDERPRNLVYRIRGCLKCYANFIDYSEADKIRIRE